MKFDTYRMNRKQVFQKIVEGVVVLELQHAKTG